MIFLPLFTTQIIFLRRECFYGYHLPSRFFDRAQVKRKSPMDYIFPPPPKILNSIDVLQAVPESQLFAAPCQKFNILPNGKVSLLLRDKREQLNSDVPRRIARQWKKFEQFIGRNQ